MQIIFFIVLIAIGTTISITELKKEKERKEYKVVYDKSKLWQNEQILKYDKEKNTSKEIEIQDLY